MMRLGSRLMGLLGMAIAHGVEGGAVASSRAIDAASVRLPRESAPPVPAGFVPCTVHGIRGYSASLLRPGNHTANRKPTCTAAQARYWDTPGEGRTANQANLTERRKARGERV